MLILTNSCEDVSFLGAVLFIKNLILIIAIIVPIILVVLLSLDLAKAIVAGDEEQMKNAQHHAFKRIIYALVIFFVPIVVNGVFTSLGANGVDSLDCYNNATSEKIAELEKKQNVKGKARQVNDNVKTENTVYDKHVTELREKALSTRNFSNNISDNIYNTEKIGGSNSIAITAEALAWPEETDSNKIEFDYGHRVFNSWSELEDGKPTQSFMSAYDKTCPKHFTWPVSHDSSYIGGTRVGASSDKYVAVVIRYSGYDKDFPTGMGKNNKYLSSHSTKWSNVSKPERGDICINDTSIKIYLGDGKVADAEINKKFAYIHDDNCDGYLIYRANK